MFYEKRCSKKFSKVFRKTPVLGSLCKQSCILEEKIVRVRVLNYSPTNAPSWMFDRVLNASGNSYYKLSQFFILDGFLKVFEKMVITQFLVNHQHYQCEITIGKKSMLISQILLVSYLTDSIADVLQGYS